MIMTGRSGEVSPVSRTAREDDVRGISLARAGLEWTTTVGAVAHRCTYDRRGRLGLPPLRSAVPVVEATGVDARSTGLPLASPVRQPVGDAYSSAVPRAPGRRAGDARRVGRGVVARRDRDPCGPGPHRGPPLNVALRAARRTCWVADRPAAAQRQERGVRHDLHVAIDILAFGGLDRGSHDR